MGKVYFHIAGKPDRVLGRVEKDGRVFRDKPGFDEYVGWVDLDKGRIYRKRFGPDEYIGSLDLTNGKIYRQVPLARDEYLGEVNERGFMYQHVALAADHYLGVLVDPESIVHTAAAYLLLVLPVLDEKPEEPVEKPAEDKKPVDPKKKG